MCKNSTRVFAVSPLNMQFAIQEKMYSSEKAEVVGNGGTIGVSTTEYDIAQKSMWRKNIRL